MVLKICYLFFSILLQISETLMFIYDDKLSEFDKLNQGLEVQFWIRMRSVVIVIEVSIKLQFENRTCAKEIVSWRATTIKISNMALAVVILSDFVRFSSFFFQYRIETGNEAEIRRKSIWTKKKEKHQNDKSRSKGRQTEP